MNVNPFRRRHAAAEDSPVESALRRSLARHAFDTPDADSLTRRILAAAPLAEDEPDEARSRTEGFDSHPDRGPWKTWGLPLVAAAAVIAVVGVGAGIASLDNDNGNGHSQQAATGPATAHATVTETQTVSPTGSGSPSTQPQIKETSGLTNVKILDLTFYKANDGVALASSRCTKGAGRCLAMLRTTDGRTWKAFSGKFNFDVPGVTTGCPASRCVDHIRFANSNDGYAYGPDAFFTTTDGGANWTPQSGGAVALESLGGNVIRVSSTDPSACPPGCTYTVQTAGIGTSDWTTVPLPNGDPLGDGVQLSRGGANQNDAYLLVTQNPAGGSNNEKSTLFHSSDNGADWTAEGEPCPQLGGEVDSYQVVAGNDQNVTVLCRTRATGPYRIAVSTDGGVNFTRAAAIAYADVATTGDSDNGGALPTVLADSGKVLAVAGNGVDVSTDGGSTFTQSQDLVGTFASVGFESTTVGRAVSADGTQIWTTRNAGRTWHEATP